MESFFAAHNHTISALSAIATAAAAIFAAAGLHVATRQFRTVVTARLIAARQVAANSILTSENDLHDHLYLVVANRSAFPVFVNMSALTFQHNFTNRRSIVVPDHPFFAEGGRTLEAFSEHSIVWISTDKLLDKTSKMSLPARLTLAFQLKLPASSPMPVRLSQGLRKAIRTGRSNI